MSTRPRLGDRSAPAAIGFAVLTVVQVAVVILMTTAAFWTENWLRLLALLATAGGIGAGAMLFAYGRRLSRAHDVVRREIDSLAAQPLTELLAEAIQSRDIAGFGKHLPVLSDGGLAQLTDRIEDACATALRLAAEHEDLRLGYSEVFVNMFRRTQTLLQRQLQVIERLEQGNRSPEDMHLLFQLDHLVTRMRRNNENVLVLAGTELVRATKNPVTIADVFRAAMSEVDKYQRIRVLATPSIRVSNTAAGDLIRIIAELLDNATAFSPPDKEVTINAELGRHQGLSIGVFDNGIGMSDEDIRRVNEQLTKLGSVEIARSRRVGLFVVGRLAGRNGFKVELFGGDDVDGVSALVSVPSSVLLEEDTARATLRGDVRVAAGRRELKEVAAAVAVTTSVRAPARRSALQGEETSFKVSSWYSRSKERRTERDSAVKNKAHSDVPEELPMRVPGVFGRSLAVNRPVEHPEPSADGSRRPEQTPARAHDEPAPHTDGREARVASRWFKAKDRSIGAGQAPPTGVTKEPAPTPKHDSHTYSYTEDGLPLRRQGEHLAPDIAAQAEPVRRRPDGKAVERDPVHMRRRLSSYQLGVQKALEQEDRMRGRQQHTGGWTVLERKVEK
jgi:signal transduction histidine kinase